MDELVQKAMARWPQVPAVYGWLRLDARGNWWLVQRDREGFSEERDGKGSSITSTPIIDFIWRNYQGDEQGWWFWQNGPQRVFVTLERAPWIVRIVDDPQLKEPLGIVFPTGELLESTPTRAVLEEATGAVYFQTAMGAVCVDDRNLARLDARLSTNEPFQINVGTAERPVYLLVEQVADVSEVLGFESTPRPD